MTAKDQVRTRRRLPRKERERQILDEAVRFFAEVGFEGQTRALAQRLGVTQPLLYRYFPDKDALIERVYQQVFVGGWDPAWSSTLGDRSRPLSERLTDIYTAYVRANMSYERVRLFMFASLKDRAIADRYLTFIENTLLVPLVREIRAEAGLPAEPPATPFEIECVAGLHGAIGYVGFRRWLHRPDAAETARTDDIRPLIATLVTTFVAGAPAAFRALAGLAPQPLAP